MSCNYAFYGKSLVKITVILTAKMKKVLMLLFIALRYFSVRDFFIHKMSSQSKIP